MRLVYDDARVILQKLIGFDEIKKDTLSYVDKTRCLAIGASVVVATDVVAHLFTQRTAHLFGNASSYLNRGQSTRLSTRNFQATRGLIPSQELSDLGRFTRAGATRENEDLILVVSLRICEY